MRHVILLVCLALLALPAGAQKRTTVAHLEQELAAASAKHKPDADIAHRLQGVELSERLTEGTLERLEGTLKADPKAAQALRLLADRSMFLEPPASELPATAAPDAAAQQKMLAAARSYVEKVLPGLPNFLATRTINRFDDRPYAQQKGGWGIRDGLHLVDTTNHQISVLDERENQPPTQGSAIWRKEFGLISGGEFGSTLGMILTDTMQGKVAWSHWEQSPAGPVAVFAYSVPREASHFFVIGLKENVDRVGLGSVTRGSAPSPDGVLPGDVTNTTTYMTRPAYKGSLWLDPETGAILRITIESSAKDGAPFRRAGIMVEYGEVEIGDGKFICPTRSLAFTVAVPDPHAYLSDAPTEWLNETLFAGYHRFGTTTRIITDTPVPQ